MRGFVAAVLAFILAGCAQLQNVTVDELRAEKHKSAEGEIPLTIPQIQQTMYDYGEKCRSIGNLSLNPGNPGRAMFVTYMPGLTDSSAAMLIDLQQVGLATRYQGYVYYTTWKRHLDDALSIMRGQQGCTK